MNLATRPISLDEHLDCDQGALAEIDREIGRVTRRLRPMYVGMSDNDCLEPVGEEQKDWNVWPLVDTEFGESDYYTPRPWHPIAKRFFPKLTAFIDALPIEGVGRAMIMSIDPGTEVHRHIDTQFLDGRDVPGYDRLLNLSFGEETKKRLYMHDPETGEKEFFKGKLNWIDVSDWHGVDPSDSVMHSVRVDARLKPEFREKLRKIYGV